MFAYRSGLAQEIKRIVEKNPAGQIPAKSIAKKYNCSESNVQRLAIKARKEFGTFGKVPKGGPRANAKRKGKR